MNTEQSDQVLCENAAAGCREAFSQLIKRHQSAVCALTFALTADREESEELAQETFVIAWNSLARVKDPSRVGPWLRGIARNLARRHRRKPRPLASQEPEQVGSNDDDPEHELLEREERLLARRLLLELPVTYREALVLYYRQGLSANRVADELGISVAAVEQRLSRGRKALRDGAERIVADELQRTRPGSGFHHRVFAALGIAAPACPGEATPTGQVLGSLAVAKSAWVTASVATFSTAIVLTGSDALEAAEARAGVVRRDTSAVQHLAAMSAARASTGLDRRSFEAHRDDSAAPEVDRDAASAQHELSRQGTQFTINLEGGPSNLYAFRFPGEDEPLLVTGERGEQLHQGIAITGFAPASSSPSETSSGTVSLLDGRPATDAFVLAGHVRISTEDPVGEDHISADAAARPDPAGRFSLDVPLGQPSCLVAVRGSLWSQPRPTDALGSAVQPDLVVVPGGRVSGVVRRVGEPALATITARNAQCPALSYVTRTDIEGRYDFTSLAPGRYELETRSREGVDDPRSPMSVTEVLVTANGLEEVDLELPAGPMLAVRSEVPDDAPEWLLQIVHLVPGHHDFSSTEALVAASKSTPGANKFGVSGDRSAVERVIHFDDLPSEAYTVCAILTAPTALRIGDAVCEHIELTDDPQSVYDLTLRPSL